MAEASSMPPDGWYRRNRGGYRELCAITLNPYEKIYNIKMINILE
jgi:hypothetical protein